VKPSNKELLDKVKNAIYACFENVPFLQIKDIKLEANLGEPRPDLIVNVTAPDGNRQLIVEVKASGHPALARGAINQILEYRTLFEGAYGVFAAPFISPRAAEMCTERDIGYVDLSGNCRLCFGHVYVEKKGKPNLFPERRDLRSLYSPKAERILRVLLTNPKRVWKTQEMAKEANVSVGQVSKVKKILSDREWIKRDPVGIALSQPRDLLSEWAANYSAKRNEVLDFYSLKKTWEIEADLAEVCSRNAVRYALTGFSGAARLAPAVRYQRASAYVDAGKEDLISWLGLREVSSGANFSVIRPYDEGVFYGMKAVDGICTASPIQIYLDLMSVKGRGEEAAQAVMEKEIEALW